MKITHIINPVKVSEASDLYVAQPVTFESMRRAKSFAKEVVNVNLVTTQYPEDREIIPDFFTIIDDLDRSILDIGHFIKKRKLPLIADIIDRAISFDPTAEYIIYTNSDIALMPHFYLFVAEKIKQGFDAFVINRRTIDAKYRLETLDEAYSDYGKSHPGFDCFIFKRDVAVKFELGSICIGTTRIGLALVSNLIMHCRSFNIFEEIHATFHIGEDRIWENMDYLDYVNHNENQALIILNKLKDIDSEKFINCELINKHYTFLLQKENRIENKRGFIQKIFNQKK